ncbi:MAG: hypothetical protein P1U40_13250 [Coxiellaceae bacterium]|nr:hypothetical protein [Coxiellaceae bacterium]
MSRIFLLYDQAFHREFTEKALRTFQLAVKLLVSSERPRPDAEDIIPVLHQMSVFEFGPMFKRLGVEELGSFITTMGYYFEALITSKDDPLLVSVVAKMKRDSGVVASDDPDEIADEVTRARYQLVTVISVLTLYEPGRGFNQLAKLYPVHYRELAALHAMKFHLQQDYMAVQANYEGFAYSFLKRESSIQVKIDALNAGLLALYARLQKKLAMDQSVGNFVGRLTFSKDAKPRKRWPNWQKKIEAQMEAKQLAISKQNEAMKTLHQHKVEYANRQRELAAKIGRNEEALVSTVFLMGVYERVAQRVSGEAAAALPEASAAEDKTAYVRWMAQFIASTVVKDTTKTVERIEAKRHEQVRVEEVRQLAHGVAEGAIRSMLVYHACMAPQLTVAELTSPSSPPAAVGEGSSATGRGHGLGLFRALSLFSGGGTPPPPSPSVALSDDGGWGHSDEEPSSDAETEGDESPSFWLRLGARFH